MRGPRRGFTLVEITVVVALVGLLAVALHQAYVRHGRFVAWQGRAVAAHDAFRVAGSLLAADLREAVPALGDVALLDSDSISVRMPTGFAFVCAAIATPTVLAVDHVIGQVADERGDSLLLYSAAGWRTVGVVGIDSPGQRGIACSSGTPEAQYQLPNGATDSVPVGGPVRVFERQLYHLVVNGGAPWLARSGSAGTEPLVGPLASGGLRFRLLDANGADVSVPDSVAGVEFRLIIPGQPSPGSTRATADTVVSVIQVRNR